MLGSIKYVVHLTRKKDKKLIIKDFICKKLEIRDHIHNINNPLVSSLSSVSSRLSIIKLLLKRWKLWNRSHEQLWKMIYKDHVIQFELSKMVYIRFCSVATSTY